MKFLISFIVFFSCSVNANISRHLHVHEITLVGVLSEPYKRLEAKIELNSDTDNVSNFTVLRGNEKIEVPHEIILKLQSIELNKLEVTYEDLIEWDENGKSKVKGVWLHFTMQFGKLYSIKNDYGYDVRGRDEIKLTITPDNKFEIEIRDVKTTYGNTVKVM